MGKSIDLTGQKFGRLTVIEKAENKGKYTAWICKCECGENVIVRSDHLKSGFTKSCGCLRKKSHIRHGLNHTRIYKIWSHMKSRCCNQKDCHYKYYGDRGIKVCDEWLNDFEAFYNWAMSNGYDDTLTIDRIDVNGNYEPSNCRWATRKEQSNNRRSNHLLTYNNKTQTIKQWADEYNITYNKLSSRINKYNWTIERALNTP